MIRVLIADDNAVIRSGLAGLLDVEDGIAVVAQASTGKDALHLARTHLPHVALLDVRMPVMDGLTAAGPLSELCRVLMLTYADDAEIVTGAIRAGAAGYLVHGTFTPEDLVRAVRDVHAGRNPVSPSVAPALFAAVRDGDAPGSGPDDDGRALAGVGPARVSSAAGLTDREREVMDLVARGLPNQGIAERLFLSEKTVKNHINRAYAKLGVGNRAQAIATWLGTAP